ncbi:MAG: TIGR02757 family protein [Bacteroides sp.]|nr:TIGR02757 family protein [Barnesiella sp.]MBD5367680.1 TIGR02757 family protein [Bacteroides sp.]
MTENDLRELLDSEAARINSPAFIADDPVQFPRRFTSLPDIEISSLLTSAIAWGNRKMICRDCDRMLALMDNSPYQFMADGEFELLPDDDNIHRTFFNRNLKHFLRGLRAIYACYGTLAEFARHHHIADEEYPAWKLVEEINRQLAVANGGNTDSRCLPLNIKNTALKRVNMALRWLVRDDGIVDMGVWNDVLKPSQLYIPLDVHVADTASELGLLTRSTPDRKAVTEITGHLRRFRPDDPVIYDYALFGIGMKL